MEISAAEMYEAYRAHRDALVQKALGKVLKRISQMRSIRSEVHAKVRVALGDAAVGHEEVTLIAQMMNALREPDLIYMDLHELCSAVVSRALYLCGESRLLCKQDFLSILSYAACVQAEEQKVEEQIRELCLNSYDFIVPDEDQERQEQSHNRQVELRELASRPAAVIPVCASAQKGPQRRAGRSDFKKRQRRRARFGDEASGSLGPGASSAADTSEGHWDNSPASKRVCREPDSPKSSLQCGEAPRTNRLRARVTSTLRRIALAQAKGIQRLAKAIREAAGNPCAVNQVAGRQMAAYNEAAAYNETAAYNEAAGALRSHERAIGSLPGRREATGAPRSHEQAIGSLPGRREATGAPRSHERAIGSLAGRREATGAPRSHEWAIGSLPGRREATGAPRSHEWAIGSLPGRGSEAARRQEPVARRHISMAHPKATQGQTWEREARGARERCSSAERVSHGWSGAAQSDAAVSVPMMRLAKGSTLGGVMRPCAGTECSRFNGKALRL
jgi:hypothetical protein